jgi:hypothetical protein
MVLKHALVLLSQRMVKGQAKVVAILDEIGAVVGLAVAAALQAVDGIALKAMVNACSNAPESKKKCCFMRHLRLDKSRSVLRVS